MHITHARYVPGWKAATVYLPDCAGWGRGMPRGFPGDELKVQRPRLHSFH